MQIHWTSETTDHGGQPTANVEERLDGYMVDKVLWALMVRFFLMVWCCLPRGECAAWLQSGDWCRLIDLLVR